MTLAQPHEIAPAPAANRPGAWSGGWRPPDMPNSTTAARPCRRCGEIRPASAFDHSKGDRGVCVDCRRNADRARRGAQPHQPVTSLPGEEWRSVVSFEGRYEVSSLGRVRSIATRFGHPRQLLLKPKKERTGYLRVGLRRGSGPQLYFAVHRLVARAFVPAIPGKEHVNHKDSDRTNNSAGNLEWVTCVENVHHARDAGRMCHGERTNTAKLTESDVRTIRALLAEGLTMAGIGRRYGVCTGTIAAIRDGRSWARVR